MNDIFGYFVRLDWIICVVLTSLLWENSDFEELTTQMNDAHCVCLIEIRDLKIDEERKSDR